jgi:hypothetical protein
MPEPQELSSGARLSDDTARSILARAIDLEHAVDSGTMTVMQLRELAQEAGISPQAFEAALLEAESGSEGHAPASSRSWLAAVWARLNKRVDREVSRSDLLTVSVAAALLVWIITFALTRFARAEGWQAMEMTIFVSMLAGAGLARRLGARLVAVGILGLAAFQAAELAMHTLYGIQAVQGGPTHWAVMIAGVLGALFGSRFERGVSPTTDRARADASVADRQESEPMDWTGRIEQAIVDLRLALGTESKAGFARRSA